MNIGITIAAVLISFAIGIPIGITYRKKIAESKISSAEEEAKKLVEMAKIEAENLKKAEKQAIEAQIAELQAKLKTM